MRNIAFGGSAADPPHYGHMALIWLIMVSDTFDHFTWIPSGSRSEKNSIVSPDLRVAMTDLLIPDEWLLENFLINYADVYRRNTPSISHLRNMQSQNPNDTIWWVTGSDSVTPNDDYAGECEIYAKWRNGPELMQEWAFLIIPRGGFPLEGMSLPEQFEVLNIAQIAQNHIDICPDDLLPYIKEVAETGYLPDIRSTVIREQIANGEAPYGLPPMIYQYIKLRNLYQ